MSVEKRLSLVDRQSTTIAASTGNFVRRNSLRFSIAGFFGLRELFEREYSFEEVSKKNFRSLYQRFVK